MEELGTVTAIPAPGLATIAPIVPQGCSVCGACSACRTDGGRLVVDADDPVGAAVGQRVRFELPAGEVLKSSAIVYLAPLGAFLAAYFLVGLVLLGRVAPRTVQLASAAAGMIAMTGGYLAVVQLMKGRAERLLRPRIVAILDDTPPGP